jgi:hypothetical protein
MPQQNVMAQNFRDVFGGEIVRLKPISYWANLLARTQKELSSLIGGRSTLTSSPPNHIHFLLVRAKKIAKRKTSLRSC